MPTKKKVSDEARFWSLAGVRGVDDCWGWTRSLDKAGYGHIQVGHYTDGSLRRVRAHRYAWELTYGAIPAGLYVCHTCDNPRCVNPLHLFLGTQAENMRDMTSKGRRAAGDTHGNTAIRDYQLPWIRSMLASGITAKDIARAFGVSRAAIGRIARGETRVNAAA
jgi:hypothetical protein